jgi:hypothetical protein
MLLLERNISSAVDEATARNRAKLYLENLAYKPVSIQPDMIFRRGSVLGSLTSFTPRSWRVKVTIEYKSLDQGTYAAVAFNINTSGQVVTDNERKFWNEELSGLEAIIAGTVSPDVSTQTGQKSLVENLLAFAFLCGLTLAFAFLARAIWHSQFAFYSGGFIGLVLGLEVARRWIKFSA